MTKIDPTGGLRTQGFLPGAKGDSTAAIKSAYEKFDANVKDWDRDLVPLPAVRPQQAPKQVRDYLKKLHSAGYEKKDVLLRSLDLGQAAGKVIVIFCRTDDHGGGVVFRPDGTLVGVNPFGPGGWINESGGTVEEAPSQRATRAEPKQYELGKTYLIPRDRAQWPTLPRGLAWALGGLVSGSDLVSATVIRA